jgi:hypothetical protein
VKQLSCRKRQFQHINQNIKTSLTRSLLRRDTNEALVPMVPRQAVGTWHADDVMFQYMALTVQ